MNNMTMKTTLSYIILKITFSSLLFAADNSTVSLTGPKVVALNDQTRELITCDIDNDKRMDLAIANNDKMQIELLYQRNADEMKKLAKKEIDNVYWKPIIDDAPFYNDSLLIGDYIYALDSVDFDNDGMTDFIYCGKSDRLTVKFQTKKGQWEESWKYDKKRPLAHGGTLAVADINADGKEDIVALVKGAVLIFYNQGNRKMPNPVSYTVHVDDAQELKLVDINHDNKLDIAYFSKSDNWPMRIRQQKSNGKFGPELAVPMQMSSSDWNIIQDKKESSKLVTIHKNRGEILFSKFEKQVAGKKEQRFQARQYHVPTAGKLAVVYAHGDFNGDGRLDVAAADPNSSSVYLFFHGEDGHYDPPLSFPSFSSISSMSACRSREDKRDDLVICSKEEKIVGLSEYKDGRLSFPKPLETKDDPLLAETIEIDGDAKSEIIVVSRDGRRFNAEIFHLGEKKSKKIKLGSIVREPEAIIVGDFNQDKKSDCAILIPREAARFLISNEKGELEDFEDESGIREGQFKNISSALIGQGDFNGNGKDDIILCREGYIRAYQINKDKFEMVDQVNSRQAGDEINSPLLIKYGDKEQLFVYDHNSASLQVFERKDNKAFIYRNLIKIGKIDLQKSILSKSDNGSQKILLLGRHGFWSLPLDESLYTYKKTNQFRSSLDNIKIDHFALGDINQDGKSDVVIMDGTNHVMEFFVHNEKSKKWESNMFFKVFEKDRHVRQNSRVRRREPREMLIDDFNNDGKKDLVLLCHDRVLLYPQK